MYTDYIMSKRTTLSNCKKCSNSNEKLVYLKYDKRLLVCEYIAICGRNGEEKN